MPRYKYIPICAYLVLALAFLPGCKKSSSIASAAKVKSVTSVIGGTSIIICYIYDSHGREIEQTDTFGNVIASYVYSTDSLIATPPGSATSRFALNSNGQVITGTPNYTYIYNDAGNRIAEYGTDTITYTWQNGNLMQSIQTGSPSLTNTYQYSSIPETRDFGDLAFGKQSLDLFSSHTVISHGVTDVESFTYQFDNNGRVASVTSVNSAGNQIVSYYTYY